MPTSVGNDANYMTADNVSAPEINLGVTLMATQTPYESDSFGIDYDAAAAVNTEEELRDAVAQGGDVVLYSDIELTDELDINTDTVLDLSGNTIVFSADTYGSNSSSSDPHNLSLIHILFFAPRCLSGLPSRGLPTASRPKAIR